MRLNLFSLALFLILTGVSTAEEQDAATSWNVDYGRSRVDDSAEIYATTQAVDARKNDVGAVSTLAAFCQEKRIGLILQAERYWGIPVRGNGYEVIIRIDGAAATRRTWGYAATGDIAFYPGNAVAFLKSLAGKKKMFVRVTDGLDVAHESDFNIEGADEIARIIQAACSLTGAKSR